MVTAGDALKRIAIFCDGTWNRDDAKTPTHVVRLAQSVRPTAADGVSQYVIYIPGVGIGQGVTRVSRFVDRIAGGAFGLGLDDRILEAYRALIFSYEPGDQIYIFGFSRGAYTARSLVGLIRTAGIPMPAMTDRIPEAMALYRARGEAHTKPDSGYMLERRRSLSPQVATSEREETWRRETHGEGCLRLKIAFLGVWDTVGALGLPKFLGLVARFVNAHYAFHDAALSSSVAAARHAVAIDERRRHYPPTLWDNLDCLNDRYPAAEPRYRQLWFAGTHGIVGGSGRAPALSAFPTGWIAAGARKAGKAGDGLDIDDAALGALIGRPYACADDKGAPQRPGWSNLFGLLLGDRLLLSDAQREAACKPDAAPGDAGTVFPAWKTWAGKRPAPAVYDLDQISEAARERVRRCGYRPMALATLTEDIFQVAPGSD